MGCGSTGCTQEAAPFPPTGVAVRYSDCPVQSQPPAAGRSCGLWHAVSDLDDGRLALVIGHSADHTAAADVARQVTTALRETGDPAAAVAHTSTAATESTALCAVIERPAGRLSYSCVGVPPPVLAAPDAPPVLLDPAVGLLGTARLAPASTLLLCTAATEHAAPVLAECACLHPDPAADRIIGLPPFREFPLAVILYRQPPGPLKLTLPAAPTNLTTVRNHLRRWLALIGVDDETGADALLAVGEAASNATEHAAGAGRDVDLTVGAEITDGRLRFTVSDNGSWKPPSDVPGNRGHGIRLINALVDDVDLITNEQGTTVYMVKEIHR